MFLRNFWCNLRNLLHKFMYFLFFIRSDCKLEKLRSKLRSYCVKKYAFQMFLRNAAYCCVVLRRITILLAFAAVKIRIAYNGLTWSSRRRL